MSYAERSTTTALDAAAESITQRRRTWAAVPLALSMIGLAISIYLTAAHYEGFTLACSVSATVDCAAVTHSAYAQLGGTNVPVSAAGVLWFGLMSALAGLRIGVERSGLNLDGLRAVTAVVATAGILFVLYLVYVELVVIHRICEWCSAVHVLSFALFVLSLRDVQQIGKGSVHDDD